MLFYRNATNYFTGIFQDRHPDERSIPIQGVLGRPFNGLELSNRGKSSPRRDPQEKPC